MRNKKFVGLVVAGALLAGSAVGGATAALWSDSGVTSGQIKVGSWAFNVSSDADQDTTPGNVTIGVPQARQLVADGQLAVLIKVDTTVEGGGGLQWGWIGPRFDRDSVFGKATWSYHSVDDPALCVAGATDLPGTSRPVGVAADLDGTTTTSNTEYLCVLASLPLEAGRYHNTGSATGTGANGQPVSSQDGGLDESGQPVKGDTNGDGVVDDQDGSATWVSTVMHDYKPDDQPDAVFQFVERLSHGGFFNVCMDTN